MINYSQRKKDKDLPLGNYLETQSIAREDNTQREMLANVDNHADKLKC